MAECNDLENIPRGCGNNVGTVKRLVYNHQSKITSVTKDALTGIITAVVHTEEFKEIEFRKGQAQFTDASAIDLVAESSLFPVTVQMNLKRRTGLKAVALRAMADGQPYMGVFVQDGNDIWWYFPNMQLSSLGGGSGETRAAGTNYDTQLMNEEAETAWEVAPSVIVDILAAP